LNVFHYILGRQCLFCGRTVDPRDEFCPECRKVLDDPHYRPAGEGQNSSSFLFYYYGPVREGLLRYKYAGKIALGKYCGRALAERFRFRGDSADVVTCVPRAADGLPRPYNQSGVIAKTFAKELGIPFDPHLLRKRTGFRSQTNCIDAHARKLNAEGAFRIGPSKRDLHGLRVVIIDDLYTTGSTMNACKTLLKKRGAESVGHYTAMRAGPYRPRLDVNPDHEKRHYAFQNEDEAAARRVRNSRYLQMHPELQTVWKNLRKEKLNKNESKEG
jgi:ComF family protein